MPALALAPVPSPPTIPGETSDITDLRETADGRLFIVQRKGLVLILEDGAILPEPFLDVRSLVATDGLRGLVGLVFDTEYAQNGFFYVNYTSNDPDHFGATVIARYQVSAGNPDAADPSSGKVLLRLDMFTGDHNAGQLEFGPDGYLYVGTGDGGGGSPDCAPQRKDRLLGKILRLDVRQSVDTQPYYGIPPTNPFASEGGETRGEIWAMGLRNPYRFSFDRLTGDLYIADPGRNSFEEVNRQPASSPGGENYGWKIMEGSHCGNLPLDNCPTPGPSCMDAGLTLPIHDYPHGGADPNDPEAVGACAVIGGPVYRGNAIPALQGRYIFGDFCDGIVRALDPESGAVIEVLDTEVRFSLTTFGEGQDGELFVVLADQIHKIVKAEATLSGAMDEPGRGLLAVLALAGASLTASKRRRSGRGREGRPARD